MDDKKRAEAGLLTEACLKCGVKLGGPYLYEVMGLRVEIGHAWVYDEDDVLCHVCMDDEVLAQGVEG